MLFDFENMINNTLENKKDTTFDLENSFLKGNSFKDLYDEYKDYKPKSIKVSNERDALLVKIMMLEFGIIDLNLKLAVDPDNKEIYEKFVNYSLMYEKCLKEYEKKYQVLDMCHDTFGKYTYDENPWPWEVPYV